MPLGKSAKLRATLAQPGQRARLREQALRQWADPECAARMRASLRRPPVRLPPMTPEQFRAYRKLRDKRIGGLDRETALRTIGLETVSD